MQDLDEQRAVVARAVGAVAVEGPYEVAVSAEDAAGAIEGLAERLRDWIAESASRSDRRDLVQSQGSHGNEHGHHAETAVDGFTAECRKVLHPAESKRPKRRRR
jgi:hypothetical protein